MARTKQLDPIACAHPLAWRNRMTSARPGGMLLCILFVILYSILAAPAAAQLATRIHIPTIINYYTDAGVSKGDQKVKDAIKEANRILKKANAEMQLILVKEIDPASAGDAGNDGEISGADSYKEMKALSKAGWDEVKKYKNKTGFKISFVEDCWNERPGAQGWNFHTDPVMCVEGSFSADDLGNIIVHELSHYLRGSITHSNGANDVTSSNALNGDNIPAAFLAEMKKKKNRRKACKCSNQFDSQFPGVREEAQRGVGVDDREDQESPPYTDLVVSRLLSVNGSNQIDGFLSVDGFFESAVDTTYVVTFDSDNDYRTGFSDGPFTGREYSVEFHVTGDFGVYTISGLIRDLSDASTTPLSRPPAIFKAELHDQEFVAEDSAIAQLQFEVEKDLIGLDIDYILGISPDEIPVGVFVKGGSTIHDSDSFLFTMDHWLRDPLLQTFGNGVPKPGEPYPIQIEGLQPNDSFNFYLNEDLIFSGVLSPTGTFDGSFIFPVNLSNAEPHFLTAQDSTGEFAYGMTCPNFDALAVTLALLEATVENGAVTIRWTTKSEIDNEGFFVLRSIHADGEYEEIRGLIPAKGGPAFAADYEFVDAMIAHRVAYYYVLEEIDTSGLKTRYGMNACTLDRDPGCDPLVVSIP